jgi:hypothetical protein
MISEAITATVFVFALPIQVAAPFRTERFSAGRILAHTRIYVRALAAAKPATAREPKGHRLKLLAARGSRTSGKDAFPAGQCGATGTAVLLPQPHRPKRPAAMFAGVNVLALTRPRPTPVVGVAAEGFAVGATARRRPSAAFAVNGLAAVATGETHGLTLAMLSNRQHLPPCR